jgi:hypothetical protein
MSNTKLYITILTFSVLVSCNKTINLTDKDVRWIPYKGNETLVFNSNTGEVDTIFLLGTKRETVPNDPLAISPINLDYISIASRRSDPNPPSGNQRYLEGTFLELTVGVDRRPYLAIDLTAKDAWFYGGRFLYLQNLDQIKPITLQTKNKIYKDIVILTPESSEYSERSNFLTKVYWSKSDGLVRFDKKDSIYWELTNKYGP